MSRAKHVFIKNAVAQWGRQAVVVASLIVTTPIVANHYGPEALGIILMVGQAATLIQLADAGMTSGVRVLVPRYRGRGDLEGASGVVRFTFLYLAGLGAVFALAAVLIAPLVPMFLTTGIEAGDVATYVLFSGIMAGTLIPLRLGSGLLVARMQHRRVAVYDGLAELVKLGLVLWLFTGSGPGPDMPTYAFVAYGPVIATSFMGLLDGLRANADLKLFRNVLDIQRTRVRESFSVGVSLSVISVSSLLVRQGLPFLLGVMAGPASVPLVAYPMMLMQRLSPLTASINNQIKPMSSFLLSSDKTSFTAVSLGQAIQLVIIILAALLLFSVLAGDAVLKLWLMGDKITAEYLHEMYLVLIFICGIQVMQGVTVTLRNFLIALGKQWMVARVMIVAALAGLAACAAIGAAGYPLAAAVIGYAVFQGVNLVQFSSRCERRLRRTGRVRAHRQHGFSVLVCAALFASLLVVTVLSGIVPWQASGALREDLTIYLATLLSVVVFLGIAAVVLVSRQRLRLLFTSAQRASQ